MISVPVFLSPYFSHWLEVVGAHLEKGDVMYFCAAIAVWQDLNQNVMKVVGLFACVASTVSQI